MLDCLIIGGGPAGLTAAVYLARYRRSVAVYTEGQSRAALIPKSHNYPGFPQGVSGPDLLKLLRTQAAFYRVPIEEQRIVGLALRKEGFQATFAGGEVAARTVLMATGLVDVAPEIDGIDYAVQEGAVRYCPVCDAFEAMDRRVAVVGGEAAFREARFMRNYSKDVTLIWSGVGEPPSPRALDNAGLKLVEQPASFELRNKKICVVTPNTRDEVDILYPALGCKVQSDLAARLGAATNEAGCLKVDEHQCTTVDGLYAAGDVVSDLNQIAVGTGHAAIAATRINKILPPNPR